MPKTTQQAPAKAPHLCILTEAAMNRLEILFEQVDGIAELVHSRYPGIETDGPMLTLYNVLKERSDEATRIVREGWRAGIQ